MMTCLFNYMFRILIEGKYNKPTDSIFIKYQRKLKISVKRFGFGISMLALITLYMSSCSSTFRQNELLTTNSLLTTLSPSHEACLTEAIIDRTDSKPQQVSVKTDSNLPTCSTNHIPSEIHPTPVPTSNMVQPLNSYEYYIVDASGRKGIVDGHGKVVLPLKYAEIDTLYHFIDGNDTTPADVFFLAKEYSLPYALPYDNLHGNIYDISGKKAFKGQYNTAYVDLITNIVAYRSDRGIGVMTFSEKTVIPFVFTDIYRIDNAYYALRRNKNGFTIYMYTTAGKLIRKVNIGDEYYHNSYYGDVFVVKGFNHKYGFMDKNLKWTCPPKFDDFDTMGSGDGVYSMCLHDEWEEVDETGRELTQDIRAAETYVDEPEFSKSGFKVVGDPNTFGMPNARFGLQDKNWKIVLPQVYDYLELTQGNLLFAKYGPYYGLIDIKGNWVWYISEYETLTD